MIVVLHGERLESTLPDVARGAVMALIPPGVGHEEPLHPPAHVAVGVRPDHQVEVVGHQTVSQDLDGQSGLGVGHGRDEGIIVGRLMEDDLPPIAPIEDMTPHVGDRGSCAPGHASRLSQAAAGCNISYVLAPRSSGKENHLKNVKPFIETLRVSNPVRQSRASSREASLAWGRVTVTAKRRQRDQTLCD
jgi:hypothetical protein